MKIAEIFVALGFKVEGDAALERVDRNLGRAEVNALGLLAAIGAVNAAFYALIARGVDAAVALDKWSRATGENVEEMQRWESAARRANVSAGTVGDAIKSIQRARAEIMLGNADASSPWFLLGIDPRQNPFQVLEQVRKAIAGLDPALARNLVSKMGFGDDLLYLLQQNTAKGGLFVDPAEIAKLTNLGGAWKALLYNLTILSTKFAAGMSEHLLGLIRHLESGVVLLERFVRWMNSGSGASETFKSGLLSLVVLLGTVFIALSAVVVLLGVLKGLLIAIQLIPIVAALTAFAVVLGLVIAALLGLVLLVQDFWTALDGGKSLFDWNQNLVMSIRNVERLASAMMKIKEAAVAFPEWVKNTFSNAKGYGFGSLGSFVFGDPAGYRNRMATDNLAAGAKGSTSNSANVEIHVAGSHDPVATGHEVARSVSREISDTMGVMPVPTR